MPKPDDTEPSAALNSFLQSLSDEEYRRRVGPIGVLRLLAPARSALRDYEAQAVTAARAAGYSWGEIAEALEEPKATVYRRWCHLG